MEIEEPISDDVNIQVHSTLRTYETITLPFWSENSL